MFKLTLVYLVVGSIFVKNVSYMEALTLQSLENEWIIKIDKNDHGLAHFEGAGSFSKWQK